MCVCVCVCVCTVYGFFVCVCVSVWMCFCTACKTDAPGVSPLTQRHLAPAAASAAAALLISPEPEPGLWSGTICWGEWSSKRDIRTYFPADKLTYRWIVT